MVVVEKVKVEATEGAEVSEPLLVVVGMELLSVPELFKVVETSDEDLAGGASSSTSSSPNEERRSLARFALLFLSCSKSSRSDMTCLSPFLTSVAPSFLDGDILDSSLMGGRRMAFGVSLSSIAPDVLDPFSEDKLSLSVISTLRRTGLGALSLMDKIFLCF